MSDDVRVLVTGAGGFIGGRIVEVLHGTGSLRPKAGLRRWANGARIGRLPVEMVVCDVMDPGQVERAMEGVDGVIHCARGSREVTVAGTRNVLAAGLEAGVRRVIHLSTCDVYGDVEGEVGEDRPLRRTGQAYGDAKIEAEEVCREFGERGLPVTVLRPTLVYGPFSGSWTIEFGQRIAGGWMLPDAYGTGTCNLLYVDDLVTASLACLAEPDAAGEAYNVNGPDLLTWNEYLRALAAALGREDVEARSEVRARLAASLMMPVRKSAKLLLEYFEDPIMAVYQRSDLARSAMKALEHRVRMTPTTGEFDMYRKDVHYSSDRVRRQTGWKPVVGLEEGVRLSAGWLRHHGLVGAPAGMGSSVAEAG